MMTRTRISSFRVLCLWNTHLCGVCGTSVYVVFVNSKALVWWKAMTITFEVISEECRWKQEYSSVATTDCKKHK